MSTEKYIKRVVPEHRKPRFLSWLQANLVKVDDAECLLLEIDHAFDIDEAIGTQLDVTGEITGRERRVNFEPPLGISPVLDDEMYRLLQRAKISLNQWNGTLPSLWELWERLFPQYAFVMYDNQNMTLNFYIMGDTSMMERELFSRGYIAPKPMGVRIRYEFILPDVELEDTLYLGGAVAADSSEGTILNKMLGEPQVSPKTLYIGGAVASDSRFERVTNRPLAGMRFETAVQFAAACGEFGFMRVRTETEIRHALLSDLRRFKIADVREKTLRELFAVKGEGAKAHKRLSDVIGTPVAVSAALQLSEFIFMMKE